MLWTVSAHREPCFKFYVQQAVQLGATEKEMGKLLPVTFGVGR